MLDFIFINFPFVLTLFTEVFILYSCSAVYDERWTPINKLDTVLEDVVNVELSEIWFANGTMT
jgi:hypothetical protein